MKITREERWENSGTVTAPNLVLKTATNNTYDPRNNQLSTTEAQGTTLERNITWSYDPTFNQILTQTEKSVVNPTSNKITTNSYNGSGNLIQTTITGLLGNGSPFSYTTSFTYDTNSNLKTIDGPRSDASDITTLSYDNSNNLTGITLPVTGSYTLANHDGLGNPQTVSDPNGNSTTYTYDTNGRILTIKAPGDTQATSYSYTTGGCSGSCGGAANKIKTIIWPEGNRIDFSYDDNGNPSRITDTIGNSITYTTTAKATNSEKRSKTAATHLKRA